MAEASLAAARRGPPCGDGVTSRCTSAERFTAPEVSNDPLTLRIPVGTRARESAHRGSVKRSSCPVWSVPTQLVQAVVVDAVEVRDLVHERDVDEVTQRVHVLGLVQVRLAVDDDAVGHLAETVLPALGEGYAVVQAEKVEAAVFWAVFGDEDDVV